MPIPAAIFAFVIALLTTPISNNPPVNVASPDTLSVATQDLRCLTEVIYYEAPHEPYEGRLAVATVVMNRKKSPSFPKTVCGVVYQRNPRGCQFSWVCAPRAKHGREAFRAAQLVAEEVLRRGVRLHSIRNAMFFHNTTMTPSWSYDMTLIQQIGNHLFYVAQKA